MKLEVRMGALLPPPPRCARGEVESGPRPPPRGEAVGLPPLLPPRLLARLC